MQQKLHKLLIFISLIVSEAIYAQTLNASYFASLRPRSIGPAAMSGRVTAIACDPSNNDVVYVGAASGGLWRSRNAGLTWEPIFDKMPTQSIGSVAINPRNPDEIWVGTGEGNPRNSQNFGVGIFRTLDGGQTWQCMGLRETKAIHRIIVHRDNPHIVWAAATGSTNGISTERGVFKTTDGGKTWRKVLYINELTGCAELVADPQNPNKLIAAMWEFRRWPWKFKSGGAGSGIYISHDGGETWQQRTDKDGLPEGELGRIGLAIAPANPQVVYALIEAKENALYKSTNGGISWKKMTTKGIGDRPFYYAEIYADPTDENTLYTLFTLINRSIDGGKSFEQLVGWEIHLDHHAFWIHPENPKIIFDGNDGGLYISHDGGKSWRFAENLPLGQFYHIRVDNNTPYQIYGGLQDNGTWVGPSSVWKSGGIRNSDWQELNFGDGFDALPLAPDFRYVFCMSQGGDLVLVDKLTGDQRYIKPVHPDGIPLRFHWNSAIEADPFNHHGVYFGSQFVHYSDDLGQSWQILSPDLTQNDSIKIAESKQTGGLTPDVTSAENHCTILTIAPSPVQKGVIWVGTDDGNLQLTTNGGKSWENLSPKIKGFPKNGWIPQIEVSAHNAAEAFVVVNNYRQNDWQPYLFHTRNFGKTWSRLVDAQQVEGFCLSVVQDAVVPELIFLGTDQGLYFSVDYGKNWTKWPPESFPSVPVQDMKIQQREGDLVIGTFGRAIWVLDNLEPLRAVARTAGKVLARDFVVFPPQNAYLAALRSYDGTRFIGSGIYEGKNKSTHARVPVWVHPRVIQQIKSQKKEADSPKKVTAADKETSPKRDKTDDKAQFVVLSLSGDTLWRAKMTLDSCFNFFTWPLKERGVRMPSNAPPQNEDSDPGGGPNVLPGKYRLKVRFAGVEDSTLIEVLADPRLPISRDDMIANADAVRQFNKTIERASKAYNQLLDAEKTMNLVDDQLANVPDSLKKEVKDAAKVLRDSLALFKESFFPQKEQKGIQRDANSINSKIWRTQGYLFFERGAPAPNTRLAVQQTEQAVAAMVERINQLFENQWKKYRQNVEAVRFSVFKDFQRL